MTQNGTASNLGRFNPSETAAYKKSKTLYGLTPETRARLAAGATPVLVEGAFDAEAINHAARHGNLDVVALSPCGTALTRDHLAIITAHTGPTPQFIVAFDQDTAGINAAARVFDMLDTRTAGRARHATWDRQIAKDPGELIQTGQVTTLTTALTRPRPLAATYASAKVARSPDLTAHPASAEAFARNIATTIALTADHDAITATRDALLEHLAADGPLDEQTVTAMLPTSEETVVEPQPSAPAATQVQPIVPPAPGSGAGAGI